MMTENLQYDGLSLMAAGVVAAFRLRLRLRLRLAVKRVF